MSIVVIRSSLLLERTVSFPGLTVVNPRIYMYVIRSSYLLRNSAVNNDAHRMSSGGKNKRGNLTRIVIFEILQRISAPFRQKSKICRGFCFHLCALRFVSFSPAPSLISVKIFCTLSCSGGIWLLKSSYTR